MQQPAQPAFARDAQTIEEVRELARAAYPIVLEQLTGMGQQAAHTHVKFVHPAARQKAEAA